MVAEVREKGLEVEVVERQSNDGLPFYCIQLGKTLQFGIFLSREKAELKLQVVDQMTAQLFDETLGELREIVFKRVAGGKTQEKLVVEIHEMDAKDTPEFIRQLMEKLRKGDAI